MNAHVTMRFLMVCVTSAVVTSSIASCEAQDVTSKRQAEIAREATKKAAYEAQAEQSRTSRVIADGIVKAPK